MCFCNEQIFNLQHHSIPLFACALVVGIIIGGNQRLPKIVGNDSIVREMAYTGRRVTADEAVR